MSNSKVQKENAEMLEALIDRCGVEAVLLAISNICSEKAEHIETNWQDKMLAREWARAARSIERAATHPAIQVLERG